MDQGRGVPALHLVEVAIGPDVNQTRPVADERERLHARRDGRCRCPFGPRPWMRVRLSFWSSM